MNTMEITKIVGALCGSLLVFLLIQTAAHAIFTTESGAVAYAIETPEGDGEAAPEEAVDVPALVAAADAVKGETVFKKCLACHKLDGSNGVGPHLDGVVGRDVAAVDGFAFSDALNGIEGAWDADKLYHFVANPKTFAPGTKMAFAGLPKAEDRANVIAYLQSLAN